MVKLEFAKTTPRRSAPLGEEYSEKQILASCKRLEAGKINDKSMSAAIQGLNSPINGTAKACRQALSNAAPSSFKTEHILSLIGQIKGDRSERDDACSGILIGATLPKKVFTVDFASFCTKSPAGIQSMLEKHGLMFQDDFLTRDIAKIAELKNGEKLASWMMQGGYNGYSGLKMAWERKSDQLSLSFESHSESTISPSFTPKCTHALIEKVRRLPIIADGGGFMVDSQQENPLTAKLAELIFKGIQEYSDTHPSIAGFLIFGEVDALLDILKNSSYAGNAYSFIRHLGEDAPEFAITRDRYVSLISLIQKGYGMLVDGEIQIFANAHSDDGLLTHDDIELFKKGMMDRKTADECAAVYRHVGRHYAKIITNDDLQIFIDNIDQEKPEYCSGESCGCKARAIADLANINSNLFREPYVNDKGEKIDQVKTVIKTFNTSTTYRDGSAMILGYLAVNEPGKFGERCIKALADGLRNSHEYDSAILLLNAAIKKPDIYGEKIRDIFLDGLSSELSRPQSLWALQKMSEALPELFKDAKGETKARIESMSSYSLSERKELDILNQYIHFESYFNLGIIDEAGNTAVRISNAIDLEKEAKKKSPE